VKISIVTIVYNNKNNIADCIQSVRDQNYKDIEHIVIDGGSTDGTQAIIESNIEGIAHYISEKDNGLYNALNKGIKLASGDIIGILHSDDIFFSHDTLQIVERKFQETNADLVYANGLYVDKEDESKVKRVYNSRPLRKIYLFFGWIPLHTTIFVRSSIFQKYGLYNENYSISSDYDISIRWFKNDNINKVFLNQFVVKMRLGGKSTSASLQRKKSSEDLLIIKNHRLCGYLTLFFKIIRKIPQYLISFFNNPIKTNNIHYMN
jgi:glycosyltransferase